MHNKIKLPTLDGYVVIDDGTVSILDNGAAVTVSIEEWQELQERLQFDATVDYEKGKTPMTICQFEVFVKLFREKYEGDNGRAEQFMKRVERHTDFEEITPVMIREFVEKIVVHAKGNRYVRPSPQRVEIPLSVIGEVAFLNTERENPRRKNGRSRSALKKSANAIGWDI